MVADSPLRRLHEQAEAEFIAYGPPPIRSAANLKEQSETGGGFNQPIPVVATFGELEAEYASIRKAAGLIDLPQCGVLRCRGADVHEFLNRMLTNELAPLKEGHAVRSFLLDRAGRIQSDLWLVSTEHDDEYLVDLDAFTADHVAATLTEFVFSEDAIIEDASDQFHRFALHGPKAIEFAAKVSDGPAVDSLREISPSASIAVDIGEHRTIVARRDWSGEIGLEFFCPVDVALVVHERLLESGLADGLRSIGWSAMNMARIESGIPMFLVDFGTDTLPHETGDVLDTAVSFTKGCYLGQEIVARMHSLGHPKQILLGIRVEGESLPVTGAAIYSRSDSNSSEVIGAVTSSSPSPMLGNASIAFGMIKYSEAKPGRKVLISIDQQHVQAELHDLRFWHRRGNE